MIPFSLKNLKGLFVFTICLLLPQTVCALPWGDLLEEGKKIQAGVDGRLRYELWGGLEAVPSPQTEYDFVNLRVRPYAKYPGDQFTFFFQFQYAGGFFLPGQSISGPGRVYFALNGMNDAPYATDVLEFYMQAKDFIAEGLGFKVGRQGIKDGLEVLYKDKVFNWVKKTRLSERLVGTWDWTNVGRRYDAAKAFYDSETFFLDSFASRLLAGGFEYDGAFSALKDVSIFGGSFTLKKGALVSQTEIRIFGLYYRDTRGSATQVTGGHLKIPAVGLSLVGVYPDLGPGIMDVLLWGCYQWGDWGAVNHDAYAMIAEMGYQLPNVRCKPWFRLGITHASGDNDPATGTHKSFFNMAPTNHKWYGYLDTTALSNLFNLYLQFILQPVDKVYLQADGQIFWLSDGNDSWYAGSGPSNDNTFGYFGGFNALSGQVARLTGGRKFIGGEIDLTAKYIASKYVNFAAGYSHFFGADGAQVVFPVNADADWFYLQTIVKF